MTFVMKMHKWWPGNPRNKQQKIDQERGGLFLLFSVFRGGKNGDIFV